VTVRNLNLSGCRFSGQALSAVICSLPELSGLTVGRSDVTAGCQGLAIESRTLETLHFWECSASAVTVVSAPALHALTAGLVPYPALKTVFIDLRSAEALRTLHHLALHLHRLKTGHAVWFRGRAVMALPCLDTLVVGVQFGMSGQAPVLLELLGGLPRLQKLTLCV
jgi:hypothetical protein